MLLTFLLATTSVAQSTESTVTFVDTTGKPVTPDSVLFFNGGRAKTISVEKGTGTAPDSDGIIVAHADGFQYAGTLLSGSDAEVVFHRNDQPHEPVAQTAFPLTAEIRSQLKQTLKEKLWERVEGQPPATVIQVLQILGAVDPMGTLKWAQESSLPEQMKMAVSQQAYIQLLHTDPEEALDRVSQIEDPMMRSMVTGLFLQKLPADHELIPTIENLLNETSRSIKQPAMRLALRASLAEHYQFTDRSELADKIIAQHIEEAKKLPSGGWSAYPRSLFAALIAESDPTLAEELITGIGDPNEATRAQARVAFACCCKHPELAKKLLAMYKPQENTITVWGKSIKVADKMAVDQTEAARDLASSFDEPNQKAWAFGLMAMRLNDSNPQLAKELLAQAIDSLADPEANKKDWFSKGETLAGLLPIAQQIDPTQVRPMMWQAIDASLPKTRWVSGTGNKIKLQTVAGAVARYDLELGKALLGKTKLEPGNMFAQSAARQALLAPEKLPEYTSELLENSDLIRQYRLIQQLADLVTVDESSYWKSISKPMMLNWPTPKFEEF